MTFEEINEKLKNVDKSLEIIQAVFDISAMNKEKQELEKESNSENFYNDQHKAQKVSKRIVEIEKKVSEINNIVREYSDITSVFEMCTENDIEVLNDISNSLENLAKRVEDLRITALLRGKYDSGDAILSVQSGAGGTEAQDWAEMLLRMYTRYAEKQGYKVTIIDRTPGDSAGIKGATIVISGENAYGYLKAEKGVHRLVRISPFDSNARRHTSFASIEVMPEIDSDTEIEVKDTDLKIDTFHSGGCGGQGVNTTDSAIRIKHIPTGIVVTCQNQRSQIQNKEYAMNVLRGKLAQLVEEQQIANIKEVQGTLKKIEWGSQIRSYVFCPYTMVKDHRTDYETSNVMAVMDGDLQGFINEYLKQANIK